MGRKSCVTTKTVLGGTTVVLNGKQKPKTTASEMEIKRRLLRIVGMICITGVPSPVAPDDLLVGPSQNSDLRLVQVGISTMPHQWKPRHVGPAVNSNVPGLEQPGRS